MAMRMFRNGKEPVRMVSRSSLAWRGALAVVVGLIAVVWPGITLGAFVILFAVYALIAAGVDTVRGFSSRRVGPVLGYLLLAIISVAAAVAALAWPGITVLVATVWIAVWAAVTGFTDLFLAFGHGEGAGERLVWILTGLVSVLFAFVLAVRPIAGASAWPPCSASSPSSTVSWRSPAPRSGRARTEKPGPCEQGPGSGSGPYAVTVPVRCGSFQPGRTKWHVYPSG